MCEQKRVKMTARTNSKALEVWSSIRWQIYQLLFAFIASKVAGCKWFSHAWCFPQLNPSDVTFPRPQEFFVGKSDERREKKCACSFDACHFNSATTQKMFLWIY